MVHCQCLQCGEWGRREEIPICIAGIHNTEPWLLDTLAHSINAPNSRQYSIQLFVHYLAVLLF